MIYEFPLMSSAVGLLTHAATTATGAGAGLDLTPYRGVGVVIFESNTPSGTSPTLAMKLQTSPNADKVTSVTYVGTGNGNIEVNAGPDPVAETITFTASNATTFAVSGTVTGSMGNLTVGTRFNTAQISALIMPGAVDFVNLDEFTVPTTARTWSDLFSFTSLTTAGTTQKTTILLDNQQYLRAYHTIGGTNTPTYNASVTFLAIPE